MMKKAEFFKKCGQMVPQRLGHTAIIILMKNKIFVVSLTVALILALILAVAGIAAYKNEHEDEQKEETLQGNDGNNGGDQNPQVTNVPGNNVNPEGTEESVLGGNGGSETEGDGEPETESLRDEADFEDPDIEFPDF
jgi:hypothetical protein